MPANICTRKDSMRKTYAVSKVITDSGKGNHKCYCLLDYLLIVKRKAYLYTGESWWSLI